MANNSSTSGVDIPTINKHINMKCSDGTKEELEKTEDIISIQLFYLLPIVASISLIAHYVVARVFIHLGLGVRYNVIMLVYTVGRSCFIFALIGYALPHTSICPYFDDQYQHSFPFIYFRIIYAFDLFGDSVWITMPNIILVERLISVGVIPLKMVKSISAKITKVVLACYIGLLFVISVLSTLDSRYGYSLDAAYESSYTQCGNETIFHNDCITKGEYCIFEISWNRHLRFSMNHEYVAFHDFLHGLIPVYINIFGCLVLVVQLIRISKKNRKLSGKKKLDRRPSIVVIVYCVDFCIFHILANTHEDYLKDFKDSHHVHKCGMHKFNCDMRWSEFVNNMVLTSCCLHCVYLVIFSSNFKKALLDFLPARVRDYIVGLCKKCRQCKVSKCLYRQRDKKEMLPSQCSQHSQKKSSPKEASSFHFSDPSTRTVQNNELAFAVQEQCGADEELLETGQGLELGHNSRQTSSKHSSVGRPSSKPPSVNDKPSSRPLSVISDHD